MPEYGYGLWEVTCPQCGEKRFIRAHKYVDGHVRGSENVCHACRSKNLTNRIPKICPSCGEIRLVRPSEIKERLTQYCKKCVKSRIKQHITNGRHTITSSRGYIMVLGLKDHPLANRNQQIYEHWLVFYEQHPMGPSNVIWFKNQGFTIHHKNCIRSDNRIENLELMAPGKHPRGWSIEEMRNILDLYDGKVNL